jgi:hypothetical protein
MQREYDAIFPTAIKRERAPSPRSRALPRPDSHASSPRSRSGSGRGGAQTTPPPEDPICRKRSPHTQKRDTQEKESKSQDTMRKEDDNKVHRRKAAIFIFFTTAWACPRHDGGRGRPRWARRRSWGRRTAAPGRSEGGGSPIPHPHSRRRRRRDRRRGRTSGASSTRRAA